MQTFEREDLEDFSIYEKERARPRRGRTSREFGLFTIKILTAAGALGVAITGAGFLVVNHAADNADQLRAKTKQDAQDLEDRAYVLSCASGDRLIINFNNVSVSPLKEEVGGINRNTGTIAESFNKATDTTSTTSPEPVDTSVSPSIPTSEPVPNLVPTTIANSDPAFPPCPPPPPKQP